MRLTLKVWRQKNGSTKGQFETYQVDANEHMSFLEMLDVLNQQLVEEKKIPVTFEHDCREGICGACSLVINGRPHGLSQGTTACQLHMRFFKDGDIITIEPWRAAAFPVLKDLMVDRSAFDRIIQAGGYISIPTGAPQDANTIPVNEEISSLAMDAAACIGCGACVAACPNSSAMLFTAAKVSHLGLLPQGQVEVNRRVINMVNQMDKEGFGKCSNTYACEAECPKEISVTNIARMNRMYMKAMVSSNEG